MNARQSPLKNILIIKPSALGDIALALPALSALRKSFPDARITWFVRPEFAPLLRDHPYLDEIMIFDRKFLGKAYYNPKAFSALLSLIRKLRNAKFDAVFDLQGLFRTAALAWLSGCPKRFGMADAREMAGLFYTKSVPQAPDSSHVVDYYLSIIRAAGASQTPAEFMFPPTDSAADTVRSLLTANKVQPDNYLVLIPGSAHLSKCWPAERFAALADKVSEKFGLSIVAAATKAEEPIVEKIQSLASVAITNLAGRTNLAELVALLKSAKMVVSNDTGPGHIAAALGTPLVIMFGWSNPLRIIPYGRSQCAAGNIDGRGQKIKSELPQHNVKAVTLDEVYQKVSAQLDPSSTSADKSQSQA